MKIRVTEKHIGKGIPEDCYRCPIALALIDAGFNQPSVSDHFEWLDGDRLVRRDTSPEVDNFVTDFDDDENREYCKPFEFELDV